MSSKKISELTITTSLADSDVFVVNHLNSTSKVAYNTIVGGSVGVNATWTFTVDGIQFTYAVTGGSFGSGSSHTCPIPAGSTYSASGFSQWLELR